MGRPQLHQETFRSARANGSLGRAASSTASDSARLWVLICPSCEPPDTGPQATQAHQQFWLWPSLPYYRTARVMGGLVLVLGLVLTTLANLP